MDALSDDEDRGLALTPPHGYAAGVEAVAVALRHAHEEMGVRRGVRALARVNQPGGYDCPGCAWPDPAHAHVAPDCVETEFRAANARS